MCKCFKPCHCQCNCAPQDNCHSSTTGGAILSVCVGCLFFVLMFLCMMSGCSLFH